MKTQNSKSLTIREFAGSVVFTLLLVCSSKVWADDPKSLATSESILNVCRGNDIYAFESAVHGLQTNHDELGSKLLLLFKTSRSNFSQAASAYFLGEIQYTNSIDDLASKITFRFRGAKITHYIQIDIPDYPAMGGLIKIGNPAIPAITRNLAESDDAKVRELSLRALYRIDGDKDIVRLRLQKALKSETQDRKKVRLESALKACENLPSTN